MQKDHLPVIDNIESSSKSSIAFFFSHELVFLTDFNSYYVGVYIVYGKHEKEDSGEIEEPLEDINLMSSF